jgi:hypothetical protein
VANIGYEPVLSFTDRNAVFNAITGVVRRMQAINSQATQLETFLKVKGIAPTTINTIVGKVLNGAGDAATVCQNDMEGMIYDIIEGNANVPAHLFWLPLDTTKLYSSGLNFLHQYPNPIRTNTTGVANSFALLNKNDTTISPAVLTTSSASAINHTGKTSGVDLAHLNAGNAWAFCAHYGGAGYEYLTVSTTNNMLGDNTTYGQDPYFITMTGKWANDGVTYLDTWTPNVGGWTITAATEYGVGPWKVGGTLSGPLRCIAYWDQIGTETPVDSTVKPAASKDYLIILHVIEYTSGTMEVAMCGTVATTIVGRVGWHAIPITSGSSGGGLVLNPGNTGSPILKIDYCVVVMQKAQSKIGFADDYIYPNNAPQIGLQDNCSLIASVIPNTTATTKVLRGQPFSQLIEDTSFTTIPEWTGDIIEIKGAGPSYDGWAIVREVLHDPDTFERGAAIRVQRVYDSGGGVVDTTFLSGAADVADSGDLAAVQYQLPLQIFLRYRYNYTDVPV